ncbi:MAG: cell division protein ZapA [Candidatus Aminicenantes bacterium]|nr:cell division protein ZapA [Candidatus Aminicenantes bacterium]
MRTKEIEVQVLGRNFNFNIPKEIKTEEFLEIVDFVAGKMNRIRKETEDLDSFKLGLLTSINLAEEYFSLKRENDKLRVILDKIDRMVAPFDEGGRFSISFSS